MRDVFLSSICLFPGVMRVCCISSSKRRRFWDLGFLISFDLSVCILSMFSCILS
jgi:hypothetical protein